MSRKEFFTLSYKTKVTGSKQQIRDLTNMYFSAFDDDLTIVLFTNIQNSSVVLPPLLSH